MKTIITILLASFACSGQAPNWAKGVPPVDAKITTLTKDQYVFRYQMEYFWKEYKQKCYNDSTLMPDCLYDSFYENCTHKECGYVGDECRGLSVRCKRQVSHSRYQHRRPTLEGFMEFIENYYK